MNILVVDTAATEGGALSILKMYYNKAKEDSSNNYFFLLSQPILKNNKNIKIIVKPKFKSWPGRIWLDLFSAKKIAKKLKINKVISLQNTLPRLDKGIKTELYIHQSIPFQTYKTFSFLKKSELKLAIIQKIMKCPIISSIKCSNRTIVQTKWLKQAILKNINIDRQKITIEPPMVSAPINKQPHKINNHIFFYPTSNYLYKNNNLLLQSSNVLIRNGITDFTIELTIDGLSTKNIRYIGKILPSEVIEKMQNSILVFPSYIESFGLPLLEARQCGTIILAADLPFAHEILDGYKKVIYFNPFNPKNLANAMQQIIEEGEL